MKYFLSSFRLKCKIHVYVLWKTASYSVTQISFIIQTKKRRKRDAERVDLAVTPNDPIRDVLSSNLNPDTAYSVFLFPFLVLPRLTITSI
jgi:hypothetical protein